MERARRGPGRPRQEHVMRAVLDAVVDLVAESGMAALTMDAVAARAGVSKPAMYRRWSTRQDLVLAAAESRIGPRTVPDMGDFRAGPQAVLTARTKACRQPGIDRLPAGVRGSAAEAGAERRARRTSSPTAPDARRRNASRPTPPTRGRAGCRAFSRPPCSAEWVPICRVRSSPQPRVVTRPPSRVTGAGAV